MSVIMTLTSINTVKCQYNYVGVSVILSMMSIGVNNTYYLYSNVSMSPRDIVTGVCASVILSLVSARR